MATPGHTGDSLSFLVPADGTLLTGDTVLGRGTTVVASNPPASGGVPRLPGALERMAGTGQVSTILPGHGPTLPDAAGVVRYYLHTAATAEQVWAAVAEVGRTPTRWCSGSTRSVPCGFPPAARLSVLAQLSTSRPPLRGRPRGASYGCSGVSGRGA